MHAATDLLPSRLGYGAANLGNLYAPMSDAEAWQVLEAAWDCGVRYFDTAPHYGLGLSEQRLGAFLRTKPREEFSVSTKVGRLLRPDPAGAGLLDDEHDFVVPADRRRVWDFSADGVRRSVEESLDRLGLDSVDIVYLHDPERFDLRRALDDGLPAAAALRDEGVVRAIGVGSMSVEALQQSVRAGVLDLLMVAGRLTLADQSGVDVVTECRARGIGVVAAAVFNSGLLAATPSARSRFDYAPVPPEVLARVRRIEEVCAAHEVPLPVAALHYPFLDPAVRAIVVGGATPEQVRLNSAGLADDVPRVVWEQLQTEGLVSS